MTENPYIPINTTSPTLSLKRTPCSLLRWSEWVEGMMVEESGSLVRPGETEAGRCGSKRDSSTENKPAWGGETRAWEEEKEGEGEAARKSAEGNREREGSVCVCSGLKTAQFPDAHHHPLQMILVCGHEGLAPRHHHHMTRAEESWCARACVRFWGRRLWNNFARWCLCHIISSYSGFITQLRRHFTVCDSKPLVHDMMKVLRRSFTARGETTAQLPFLPCIFTMKICEKKKKKPHPSLTLRALAGNVKDTHFLDFMHHVNTAYGLSICCILIAIMLPCVKCKETCRKRD